MMHFMRNRDRSAPVLGVTLFLILILAAASAVAGPLFQWEIRSETATITLVGSIHVGKADFFPLAAPFEDAFTAADALAVEVNMIDPARRTEGRVRRKRALR